MFGSAKDEQDSLGLAKVIFGLSSLVMLYILSPVPIYVACETFAPEVFLFLRDTVYVPLVYLSMNNAYVGGFYEVQFEFAESHILR
ncbi:hypothetical protein [Rubinisphaera margarita]|uniref:hypothetical protein n=1 Tax=Rubinisphaera margarita TaxID=2909586 RepID=UPI001EE79E1A|nr:hypothetical protein [Rubinisphaera margarita]MCG6154228.1 hypothetical protein [Rubinisphaera margarita]